MNRNRRMMCILSAAAIGGAAIGGSAWAEDCNTVGAEVFGMIQAPAIGVSDADLVRAEDLYAQGMAKCTAGDNAQALTLLDEASFLLGG